VSQNNQTNAATCSEEIVLRPERMTAEDEAIFLRRMDRIEFASRRYETRKQPSGSWAVIDSTTGSVVKEYKLPNHAGTLAAKLNKAAQS
jgi:hypothetical protein